MCCAGFAGYASQTEANQIAQPLRRLKPQKGLSSYSPSPEAGNRRHATTGQVKTEGGRGVSGKTENRNEKLKKREQKTLATSVCTLEWPITNL